MLIGSEITCVCFLDILHKVHIGGNHTHRQRQFRLKFSRPETTPTSAKARSAQVLRNSPRAMPLIGSNLPHSVVEEGIIHRVFPLTRKNSNQNCELACELKPADRQKVIQSLLGESCELNCEIMITQSLS